MTDIALKQTAGISSITVDWLMTDAGQFNTELELSTAVIVALGTDARARPKDILPDPDSTDKRGWWGDTEAEEIHDGWPIGSRLWLFKREKITSSGYRYGSLMSRIEDAVREAILPFQRRRIITNFDISIYRNGLYQIVVELKLFRYGDEIDLRYSLLWDQIKNNVVK